jgi:hypothetical protein
MIPEHINPMQWHQAVGVARQSCARFFRDGGTAVDAMRAFGADADAADGTDWGKAVDSIAYVLCAKPEKRAA